MMDILKNVSQEFNHVLINLRDKRSDDMFLMSSPWPVFILCLTYYLFVRVLGPILMKNRPAYDIKKIMLVYNISQTLLSLHIWFVAASFYFTGKYSLVCEPVDYSESKDGFAALHMSWLFFFSKIIDFLDSIFFVLRKKWTHLSTLHVVHHSIMPMVTWFAVKFVGGGNTAFAGMLNSGVHVVMYFYYFLAACGPEIQKYLWWKRYITSMQLLQFVLICIHSVIPLVSTTCGYSKTYSCVLNGVGILFFVLFSNFYRQEYMKKKKNSNENKNGTTENGRTMKKED